MGLALLKWGLFYSAVKVNTFFDYESRGSGGVSVVAVPPHVSTNTPSAPSSGWEQDHSCAGRGGGGGGRGVGGGCQHRTLVS